jgi:hypothetical protein
MNGKRFRTLISWGSTAALALFLPINTFNLFHFDSSAHATAVPSPNISTFDVTIIDRSLQLLFFDDDVVDGDIIQVSLNGTVVQTVSLTVSGTVVVFNPERFVPGVNSIEITAIGEGTIRPNTVGITFPSNSVVQQTRQTFSRQIFSNQTSVLTVGFPQIAICRTTVIFPCRGSSDSVARPYPESSDHVLEARSSPPPPILVPIKTPPGNPVPSTPYPSLLTIERLGSRSRRTRSTRSYFRCNNSAPLPGTTPPLERDE